MTPYKYHSDAALKTELEDINKLRILIKEMKKPDNFTYMDVVNLDNHLEELRRCILTQLENRRKNNMPSS